MTQQCKWKRVAEAISTPQGQDPEGIKVKINRARLGISDQPFLFPLEKRPAASYKKGGPGAGSKWFGALRDNGKRNHAGCDLMAPPGTPIFAVRDGKVIQNIYKFYDHVYALEVDHGDFVVRYGEISKAAEGIAEGVEVKQGQLIAYVGRLKKASMLHFEMFCGSETGGLTDKTSAPEKNPLNKFPPFQRRKDLMDPTSFLDGAIMLAEWKLKQINKATD
jgi:murein DD-endopeptidase MepM/ murein hydrolase activator NlpD